jgi:hypothetical protein
VSHTFYLYPTGNVGYVYYIGIRFNTSCAFLSGIVDNYPPSSNCFT